MKLEIKRSDLIESSRNKPSSVLGLFDINVPYDILERAETIVFIDDSVGEEENSRVFMKDRHGEEGDRFCLLQTIHNAFLHLADYTKCPQEKLEWQEARKDFVRAIHKKLI